MPAGPGIDPREDGWKRSAARDGDVGTVSPNEARGKRRAGEREGVPGEAEVKHLYLGFCFGGAF